MLIGCLFTLVAACGSAWADPPPNDESVPGEAVTQPASGENQQGEQIDTERARREAREAARKAAEQEAALRKAIGRHFMKVRAYYNRFLMPGERYDDPAKFENGRQRILAIQDPLAIPAIVEILSKGGHRVRTVMLEALDAFVQVDEATMYLVVVALLDPDPDVRRSASIALLKRKSDPRIVAELRQALSSDEEQVIRNAADALGVLRARQAVPDLIDRLSMQVRIEHPVSRTSLFLGVAQAFVSGYRVKAARGVAQIEPIVEGVPTGLTIGYQDDSPVVEYATIYRTEVQEALVEITGVNHGFDREAWRDWWAREQN